MEIICYNACVKKKTKKKDEPENLYKEAEDQTASMSANTNSTVDIEQPNISWQASEFVMHQKPAWWYAAFVGVALAIGLIFVFVFKDIFAAVAILMVFGLTMKLAARKPRTLQYVIDEVGISIAERTFPYDTFRSFSIIRDGGLDSIFLHPLQRFSLPIIIYFDPDDANAIAEALSYHLPHEESEMSSIDRLSRTLRF